MRTFFKRAPRALLIALLMTGLTLSVVGCGRKGQPEPPPGADYPRTYPSR
jgi:predicted small lipoprotein YifL